MKNRNTSTIGWLLASLLTATVTAQAALYDLNAGWSDSNNPNGVWTYREGTNALPHQASLTPANFSSAQPAWARTDGSSSGDHTFLPLWFKLSATPLFALDMQTGDVGMHSTDSTNGIGAGPGNVIWTSPTNGTASIAGAVWEARDIGRSNHWSLSINGVVVTGGDISAANSSRSVPFDFSAGSGGAAALANIPVFAGEVIALQIAETSVNTFGDLVGTRFTVNTVPEPSTAFFSVIGVLGLALRRIRNGRNG